MLNSFLCFQVWSINKNKLMRKASGVNGRVFQEFFIQYLAGQRFMLSFWGCRSCFSRIRIRIHLLLCLYRINTSILVAVFVVGHRSLSHSFVAPFVFTTGLSSAQQSALFLPPPSFYYRCPSILNCKCNSFGWSSFPSYIRARSLVENLLLQMHQSSCLV